MSKAEFILWMKYFFTPCTPSMFLKLYEETTSYTHVWMVSGWISFYFYDFLIFTRILKTGVGASHWEVLLVVDKISAKGSMASRSRHLWMPYTMTRVGFQIGGTLTRKVAWRAHPIFKPLFEKSGPSLNFMLYLKPARYFTFIKLLTGMQTNRPSLPKEVYLPCHSNLQFRNKGRVPLCDREVFSCPYLPYLQSTLAWKVETTAEIIPSVG